jgi:hypothetical protein
MSETTYLALPYIDGAQAQKHVTHNEALRILDALVQLAVLDKDLSAPPGSPRDGERWIVAASPTGAWAGHAGHIAAWQDGAWAFHVPKPGWIAFVRDESALYFWDGSAWVSVMSAITALQNLARLGVGTTADAMNPFAAKLNNALWSAKYVAEGGDGDLRYKLNKESAGDTLSLLFQTNWSGRAEIGLTGDDDFHFKVSPDGTNWMEAAVFERTSGFMRVQGLRHAPTGAIMSGLIVTPGGDGITSFYRVDSGTQNPRTATISSVSGDVITLTANVTAEFFHGTMTNVSYVRIWNVSKTPEQSAWVRAIPASNQLRVLNAANIATWVNGETIQVGDPLSVTAGRAIAIDISPMMSNLFGATFRQKGIFMRPGLLGNTVGDRLAVSPTGIGGTYSLAAQTQVGGVLFEAGTPFSECTQLSPVSNSNLVFVQETIGSTAGLRLLRSVALLV